MSVNAALRTPLDVCFWIFFQLILLSAALQIIYVALKRWQKTQHIKRKKLKIIDKVMFLKLAHSRQF